MSREKRSNFRQRGVIAVYVHLHLRATHDVRRLTLLNCLIIRAFTKNSAGADLWRAHFELVYAREELSDCSASRESARVQSWR
jgi:hypothetical protein